MRRCPACGYDNPVSETCGVCGRCLSDVRACEPPTRKPDRLMPALAAVLLLCALAAFFLANRRAAAPAPAENSFSDEAGFGYEGVLYSLSAMEGLRFLPPEDKLRVLPLLESHDERVACAAAVLAGRWLAEETDQAAAGVFRSALERASASGPAAVRESAAAALALPPVAPAKSR